MKRCIFESLFLIAKSLKMDRILNDNFFLRFYINLEENCNGVYMILKILFLDFIYIYIILLHFSHSEERILLNLMILSASYLYIITKYKINIH